VEIVEKGTPPRVVVEHDVGKADDLAVLFSHNGVLIQPRRCQATTPLRNSVGDNVAVKIGIQECPSVVAPPTVGVKNGHATGVCFCSLSESESMHMWALLVGVLGIEHG
jgi:hypothetical protein